MTDIVGGLRARLLRDSLYASVSDGLEALGWYDTDRRHLPLQFVTKPRPWDEPVQPNMLAMQIETVDTAYWEVGSNLTRDEIAVRFDLYAESDSFGIDVANDIRDLLRGRLQIGSQRAVFDIFDYRQTTPLKIGYAVVDDVRVEQPLMLTEAPWRRHWLQIRCVVRDAYTDDFADTDDIDELLDAIYSEADVALISELGVVIVRET